MWRICFFSCLLFAAEALAQPSSGKNQQFFKYVDEKGTIVFVDSMAKVPMEFRDRTETLAGIATKIQSRSTTYVFRRNARIVVINALLNDKVSAKMLIDPSAKQSSITPATAKKLGFDAKDPTLKTVDIMGPDGQERLPVVKIENVNLQGRVGHNVYVLIHEKSSSPDYTGILGADFLDNFRVNLDLQKGSLVLEDKERAEIGRDR